MVVTIEPGADAWALSDGSATHERVTVVSCDGATATVKSLSQGAEMEVELSALSLMEPAWPAEGHVRFLPPAQRCLAPEFRPCPRALSALLGSRLCCARCVLLRARCCSRSLRAGSGSKSEFS